ncbi:MAG: hypothetical protein ACRDTF_23040 [Pseudonocardiaceae bacterium]
MMNPSRTWIVAGATLAIAGFGTTTAMASEDITLKDPRSASIIQPAGDHADDRGTWKEDNSPESADSPAESPFDSANSGTDSPNDSPADSAGSGGSADSSN